MISTFELSDNVVGLIIDENVESQGLEEIHKIILEKIDKFGKINIFCELSEGKNVAFQCVLDELKFKYDNSQNINKFAIVTNISWLRATMGMNDFIVHTDIRSFEIKDRMKAIQWISE